MTDELVRALAVATRYRKHYDDSNPDVGMGTFLETHVTCVLREAIIPTTSANIREVLEAYKQKWRND